MKESKKAFIEFMLASNVLRFGNFVTKSGRETPYFVNTGLYNDGRAVHELGGFYAEGIQDRVPGRIDTLYGPSYKGIPLAVASAIALHTRHGRDVHYTFNRKEAKDHGEGGVMVGYTPKDGDAVVIVEDVVTAGLSIRESMDLLRNTADVDVRAIVLSVDRMERGLADKTAIQEIRDEFGVPVHPLVTVEEIVEYIHNEKPNGRALVDDAMREKILSRIVR